MVFNSYIFYSGLITDVDECKDPERCADAANCTNLDGSYDCHCSEVESHLCFGTSNRMLQTILK